VLDLILKRLEVVLDELLDFRTDRAKAVWGCVVGCDGSCVGLHGVLAVCSGGAACVRIAWFFLFGGSIELEV